MARSPDAVERLSDRLASLPLVRPRQPERLPIVVDRRRIYILPTAFGLFVGLVLACMVLGGLNYNNNPALLLAFIMVGLVNNSFVQAHLALSGVHVLAMHAEPVHAGGALALRVVVEAPGRRRRRGLELRAGEVETSFALSPGERTEVRLALPTTRRGWLDPGRLRLSTVQPYGLARAWSWLRPDQRLLVYPAVESGPVDLPDQGGDGESNRSRAHGEQVHHLREYRPGDPMRQMAWKASARADRLLVREYDASAQRDLVLDWFALPGMDREARIRRLARWVIEAERQGRRFSLRLPEARLGPGRGAEHRHACLRALALMPDA